MRAGAWDWLANQDIAGSSGALSDAARKLVSPTSTPEDGDDPVNGQLIRSSEVLRQLANALLAETELNRDAATFTN